MHHNCGNRRQAPVVEPASSSKRATDRPGRPPMRCAPSDSGQRTASGRAHDHAQPAWSPHRAQCRSTSGVQLPSMRCVRGNAGHAQVAGFVARLCSISTRQLARLPPASSRVVANAVEPNSSGTEALSSEADEAEAGAVEELNPLFNNQFASVLKDALGRQGTGSLFSGPIQSEPPANVRRPSAQEEVLQAALQNSRRNLHALEISQKALSDAIVREQKQFERLHFCLQKAVSDSAYLATIEQLLEEKRSEISNFEADQLPD